MQWSVTAISEKVQDRLADDKTPYERRFNSPFDGPIIPFGAEVKFYPLSSTDQERMHQVGKKIFPGKFVEYALNAGGGWTGDLLIADTENLETMPSERRFSKTSNQQKWTF